MNEPVHIFATLSVKFALGGALTCLLLLGCSETAPPSETFSLPMPMTDGATPFIRPGSRLPPTESADQADLELGAEVIGVSVGDVHRAYVCDAMSTYDTKVINDLIDGVPVTVTFCDRTGCARAFTAKNRSEPLNVQLGGWSGEGMLLLINSHMFAQNSDKIPLSKVSVEKSTWSEWKKLHPESDVYTGRPTPSPPVKPAE
ncbi:MAG: DUF3179 domain-containing protein [Planctomycetaceae bacterium]|nr:DUF3179 domain-containing protein [Planctomycetaceae bacterium]